MNARLSLCRYVTEAEFLSIAPVMRGRLTVEKINTIVDELAGLAERTAALVAAARRHKVAERDKKHAQMLLHHVLVGVCNASGPEQCLTFW